ncbi:MAG: pyridoxal phosphate-dependent aminotransferase [Halobacteriaceae archaeon]
MDYEEPLFFKIMSYADQYDDVIDMVSGDPDWGAPSGISEGLHEFADLGGEDYQYAPSEGIPELREEIAARRNVDQSKVIITNGAAEANHLAIAEALDYHDENTILLTDPVYPYYPSKAQLLGGSITYIPTNKDGSLNIEAYKEAVDTATSCILINNPNNPTGAVYSSDTIEALKDLAEDANAFLICDEVYDHFDHSGTFKSANQFSSSNIIITNSFSKSLAITGFRIGYGIFPEKIVDSVTTRHMLSTITANRQGQFAVLRALQNTDPTYYEDIRALLQERIETFTKTLDEIGATYTEPQGAFYVMAKFPDFEGTLDNTKLLIDKARVAGMPGETFGSTKTDWLRFALVTSRVSEAADRLSQFFDG